MIPPPALSRSGTRYLHVEADDGPVLVRVQFDKWQVPQQGRLPAFRTGNDGFVRIAGAAGAENGRDRDGEGRLRRCCLAEPGRGSRPPDRLADITLVLPGIVAGKLQGPGNDPRRLRPIVVMSAT